jgi:tetratricopeptide (TPR) repeat protein
VTSVLRFQLAMPPPPAVAKRAEGAGGSEAKSPSPVPSPGVQVAANESPAQPSANPVDFATFEDWITKTWQRLAADDLRGAELALDELRATYDLDDSQNNRVWTFYGYIYTRYADYGRAIDAYEKAVATKAGYGSDLSTSLADLYFARHQYDKALKTLLAHKERSPSGRISPEATAMIEKLRALGVTEETL